MKVSFISTVFNEEKTIIPFLKSLLIQTRLPDEIIIVDGDSVDKTKEMISNFFDKHAQSHSLIILKKKGNRSVGRNKAINYATGDVITCSDAGNVLDKKWIENIIKPFHDKKVDVVAGYYKGKAKNIFQKCLVPFVLVMPDKINPEHFLPATRSIAFTKKIWKKVGGFDEHRSHNEDFVFAKTLKKNRAKIVFAKDALVHWLPRNTYKSAFIMFYRFALGDAESGIIRSKVLILFGRYFLGLYLLLLVLLYRSKEGLMSIIFIVILYLLWSIKKNYKYVDDKKAIVILPKIQLTADVAVLLGTSYGLLNRLRTFRVKKYLKENKLLLITLAGYIGILLVTINWGVPNADRLFPFHMDEWHQLHAVGTTFKNGTPNTQGSANGTMLYFLFTGIYLIPFMILQYIDPFSLQIDNAVMRERIFEVLRLQTIIFGTLSIVTLYKICKMMKIAAKPTILLFTLTPIWLTLSGYFKYDIALIFLVLLSVLTLLVYAKNPTRRNYVLASIPVGLAVALKISALPLLLIYLFSYFWFDSLWKKNAISLIIGLSFFSGIVLLFGMPDTLFGKGNIIYYLYDNILLTPAVSQSFALNANPLVYIFTRQSPIIFGYGLLLSFIIAIGYWTYLFSKRGVISAKKYKIEVFLFVSFGLFVISILPLQIYAGGNRSLVLLPFIVLIVAITLTRIQKKASLRQASTIFITLTLIAQFYQSLSWVYIKLAKNPHEVSSIWIQNNILKKQQIGLENIPIYQHLPDIIQKEFYFNQYNVNYNNMYIYEIIDEKSPQLPSVIILTNDDIEKTLIKDSAKNRLVNRIEREGYKKVAKFAPKLSLYKTFGTETDFYIANITPIALTTTIYKKDDSR